MAAMMLRTLSSAAALAVAAVLSAAGVGKLANRSRTVAGFVRLGLPAPVVLAWAVPLTEAAVAVALLVVPAWGGVLAFALLAGFTAYLTALVRSGRTVPCGCFGSRGDHPVSGVDLVRNALLLAAAALAAASPGALRLDAPTVVVAAAGVVLATLALRRSAATGAVPGVVPPRH